MNTTDQFGSSVMKTSKKRTSRIKKTIHVIAEYFYPVTSGMEVNMLETYKNLVQNGWDVIVHTTNSTHIEKGVLRTFERINGIKINRYGSKTYRYLPFIFKIKLNRGDKITLHGNDIFPFFYFYFFAIVSKLFGKKHFYLFFTPHGLYDQVTGNEASLKVKAKKLIDFKFGSFLINKAVNGVRAVSEWERNVLIEAGINSTKTKAITNGIEDEAFADLQKLASKEVKGKIKRIGKYIIQIGRIQTYKNYEVVIRSLKLLPEDVNFLVVGLDYSKSYREKLDDLITDLKLESRVHIISNLNKVDKYYAINKSQLMVHMSKLEGFCNAVHEGISQGLVCIVSNTTALPYLIKDGVNGYCLAPNDFKAVAEKIKVWDHKKRTGKSTWLNKIYKDLKTDILVQSDADVVFAHNLVVHDLIKPLD